MRERLLLGLVVRMVLLGADGILVDHRVPFSRGSLERQGRSRLQGMGGENMGVESCSENPLPGEATVWLVGFLQMLDEAGF